MRKLTRLEALAIEALIEKFFRDSFLSVCRFHEVREIIGHYGLSDTDYETLGALHCMHWRDMQPRLRDEIYALVWGTFRAAIDEAAPPSPPPQVSPEKDITPQPNPLMLEMVVTRDEQEQEREESVAETTADVEPVQTAAASGLPEESSRPRTLRHRWNATKRAWGF